MACPFFLPERPMDTSAWAIPPRYPLGDAYSGRCTAPLAPIPTEERQADLCNYGYARGRCECFPPGTSADAVRFSLAGDRLIYIYEVEHAPSAHGPVDGSDDPVLQAQARAFRDSIAQRRNRRE